MGKYVHFDADGYITALSINLQIALDRINVNVYQSLLESLATVKVRKKDASYMRDIANSIRYSSINTLGEMETYFLAGGESRPNQSFRAIYYEYGTGTKMRPPSDYSFSSDPYRNPVRQGKVIYQRPRSTWWDLGGNRHESKTKGKPKPISKYSYVGEEVNPHFWFREGFREGTTDFDSLILEAVKSVPIASYIRLRSMVKRM